MRYSIILLVCLPMSLLVYPAGAGGDMYPISVNLADVDRDQIKPEQAYSPYQLAAVRSNNNHALQIELDGMPVRMQLAEWRRRASRPSPPPQRAGMVGSDLLAPLGIVAGVVVLGIIGWKMRRYT